MKRKFLFSTLSLLFFLFICSYAFSQNPLVKQWDYRYGGLNMDLMTSMQRTFDGGYILSGYSYSGIGGNKTEPNWNTTNLTTDYWIVKLDSLGNYQWDKRFGGTQNDELFSLQQTTDSGYILGGSSYSENDGDKTQPSWGETDYWIVKTDENGNYQWDKRFGGDGDDRLYSLQQTVDGGFILGGAAYSGLSGDKTQASWGGADYWIVKTDAMGNLQWEKRFGGTNSDFLSCIQQTSDGGYVLGGRSGSPISGDKTQSSAGLNDFWVVKTDSLGNMLWDKRFGGTKQDYLYSLNETNDKGYIFAGISESGISGDKTQDNWGQYDYWIIKTDSLGNMEWDKDFGGYNLEDDFGNIAQTIDHGFLIAGTSYSASNGDKSEDNLGMEQIWVVKTDSSGIKQWEKTIFTTGHDEVGFTIQKNHACYAMANYTSAGVGGYKTEANWDTTNSTSDFWIIEFCDTTLLPPQSFINSDLTTLCEKFCINFTDQSTNNPTSWLWQFPGGDPSSSTDQNPTNICYDVPGVYDVTLITTNANGSDTLTLHNYITVYPTPEIPTITQNDYTLTSSAADFYQWQLNTVDIPGATNQSYDVLQTGFYTVVVSDSNSCKNSSTLYVQITGIDEVNDAGISIYPNPSSGNLFVEFVNEGFRGEVSIDVVNSLGLMIYSSSEIISSLNSKREINLTKYSPGVYFIEVRFSSYLLRKKIILSK